MSRKTIGQSSRGFTLAELLMVIGVIAVLVGLLLPVLGKARDSAKRADCANRLRQLVVASSMHLSEKRRYPEAVFFPALGGSVPSGMTVGMLNEVGAFLGGPVVTDASRVEGFSGVMVCPYRMEVPLLMELNTQFGLGFFTTGYSYFGNLREVRNVNGVYLKPASDPGAKGSRRAPLWTDTVSVNQLGPTRGWVFFHGGADKFDAMTGLQRTAETMRGFHTGFSDGSVEWTQRKRKEWDLADPDSSAAYRFSLPGVFSVWNFQ
jgi:prepilin-type N-terminal cleavage/methylation domain-containing protein